MSDLSEHIESVVFKPGELLFKENESSFHFYVIQSGEVEVFKSGPKGEKIHLATVHEGSSLGEFAMLDRQPRSASAQAVTEVQAAKISEAAYQQLLQELPEWAVSVMRGLVQRLRHTNEIIRNYQLMDKQVREKLQVAEFDDSDTVIDEVPFLGNADEKD